MVNICVKTIAVRLVLPLLLFAACILRPSLFSWVYGVLCIGAFLVPLSSPSTLTNDLPNSTKLYLLVCVLVSFLFTLGLTVFNIVLVASAEVDGSLAFCASNSTGEILWRFFGLIKPKGASSADIARIILPEVLALVGSIAAYGVVVVLGRPRSTDTISPADVGDQGGPGDPEVLPVVAKMKDTMHQALIWLVRISEVLWLLLLCLTGIISPNLISVTFFLTFMFLMTWWAGYCDYSGHRIRPLKYATMLIAVLQLSLIYLFQTSLLQNTVDFSGLAMRLLGVVPLVRTNCEEPWQLVFPPGIAWPDYALPAVLFMYVVYTACQIRWVAWKDADKRRKHGLEDQQNLIGDSDDEVIITQSAHESGSSLAQGTENQGASNRSLLPHHAIVAEAENVRLGVVFAAIMRHSYALALVTMMAWAVTYHSWLTLVFLLTACILWIVPNTRKACLVTSPLVVAYAEALLIIQYIFCLKLTADEIPDNVPGSKMPLRQIGLIKPVHYAACIPLIVEVCYSVPFYLTMRLWFRERYVSTHGALKPSKYGTFPGLKRQRTLSLDLVSSNMVTRLLVKYWIYVCALVILLVSIRSPVTAYGIIYMVFFATLVCLVLMSWRLTRGLLVTFWFLVSLVSVVVLLSVYIYQFPEVPDWWKNSTGLPPDITISLGLVRYSVGELFYRLITPISFLIVVVVQLKFFHKSFMTLTDITPRAGGHSEEYHEVEEVVTWYVRYYRTWVRWYQGVGNVVWRLAEIHIPKGVALALMVVSVRQPAAVHFPMVVLAVLMCFACRRKQIYTFLSVFACIWVAAVIVTKMLFQMPFVPSTFASKNCTISEFYDNLTLQSAEFQNKSDPQKYTSAAAWAGFEKNGDTYGYVGEHVLILVILGLQAVIYHRQLYHRVVEGGPQLDPGITFPGVTKLQADDGLREMAKYLVNYVFYRFGVEITLCMAAITVSTRMDAIGVIYALIMLILIQFRRYQQRKLWYLYTIFLAVVLPLQYLSVVGLPPTECIEYPWPTEHFSTKLVIWLYLPDYLHPPDANFLIADFFQLLFVCCQLYAFSQEVRENPPGGSNVQIIYEPALREQANPVHDFITYSKTSLDLVLVVVFQYFHWITLVVIFVAGVGGISLFALGYLLACFLLLWKGNELFLKPTRTIMKFWFSVLAFSATVIFLKTSLQVVGCVYAVDLQKNFCWLIQLFSIVCLNQEQQERTCHASQNEARIVYDCAVFGFVLFQLRIFGSNYFRHAVAEFTAQRYMASRGAAYINAMMKREIKAQIKKEELTMAKIEEQIDKIQKSKKEIRQHATKEAPTENYGPVKKGGDYYMFQYGTKETAQEIAEALKEPDSLVADVDEKFEDANEEVAGPLQRAVAAVEHDFDLDKAAEVTGEPGEHPDGTRADAGDSPEDKAPPGAGALRYVWGMLKSMFEVLTGMFNKWSRNYRYVAYQLDKEKKQIKQQVKRESCRIDADDPTCPDDAMLDSITVEVDGSFKKKNVFVRFLWAAYYLAVSRTEVLCYIFMVLNAMRNASILSLFFPFMAFLWGSLCAPRPPKIFWVTIITYTEAIIVLKFLFQFDFFPWNTQPSFDKTNVFSPPKLIGIEKQRLFAVWDIVLLMILFYHRYILRVLGLWKDVEWVEAEDTSQNSSPAARKSSGSSEKDGKTSSTSSTRSDDIQLEQIKFREEGGVDAQGSLERQKSVPRPASRTPTNLGYCGYCTAFFYRLRSPLRWYLQDLYTLMFMCDLICFLILVFGYNSFGSPDPTGNVISAIKTSKIPLPFIMLLLAQFALIVIDRALYLRHSQVGRAVYHFLLVILINVLFFFVLPKVTERPFADNVAAQVWYFFKCVYFLLSAWQIRSGYPDRTLGNFLTKHYSLVNYILFKVYRLAPFVFELRTIMDWIWTDTCMPLFDYIKMENIYAYAYQIKCTRKMEGAYPFPVGVPRGAVIKYGMGLTIMILILLIIWLPLLLFSLLNTIGIDNSPTMCTLQLGIDGYPPFYEGVAQGIYLRSLNAREKRRLDQVFEKSRSATAYIADYAKSDIVKANFPYDSYKQWTVAPPTRANLVNQLSKDPNKMSFYITWEFKRPARGADPQVVLTHTIHHPLAPGSPERKGLVQAVNSTGFQVPLPHLLFPFVELPPSGNAIPATPLMAAACQIQGLDCPSGDYTAAYFEGRLNQSALGQENWWEAKVVVPEAMSISVDPHTGEKGLFLIAFVSKVFPSALNAVTKGGVVGLYVIVLVTVGNIVRGMVTGSLSDIMWEEVPNIDYILKLCLDIFLVREAKNFETELVLFSKLLFLFRSPETMIQETRMKVE